MGRWRRVARFLLALFALSAVECCAGGKETQQLGPLHEADHADHQAFLAPRVIEAMSKATHTGRIGDGKILVRDLERAARIRTGKTDAQAL